MTSIVNLRCEYRVQPLGIDVIKPRLSWEMQTERRGARQTAYRILAASQPERLTADNADVWDSGKIESDQSVHVAYQGADLQSRQRVYWRVTVWDEANTPMDSDASWFEMGLLQRSDWKAQWIGASLYGGPRSMFPAPHLRKAFTLTSPIISARLYVTALGLFECSVNGSPVSEDVLSPGWTDYHKRLSYRVYDVAPLLQSGENVIGAVLGDGWAVGHTAWNHRQSHADRPQFLAQLEVVLADGSRMVTATDDSWKVKLSPILHNDLLMGEAYDARRELPHWNLPGLDDSGWEPVEICPDPGVAIVAANGPAMRRMEELQLVANPEEKGRFGRPRSIFDFGQNMVGRIRFRGTAPAGTTVTFRFAEVLNPDGTLYTTNLRQAKATDYYTFKGEGEEVWEPKFTFHGFRYVEVSDYPGTATRDTVTGIVIYSEMPPTGDFTSSDPYLNQLQHNILWGQKGNFLDVPTDCPQRDERLGWTGDIQVFLRTAAFNMDVAGFMTKWLQDLLDAQSEDGIVPSVAPNVPGIPQDGGPAWSDAIVICPWTLYLTYGDQRILEMTYSGMVKFMDFLLRTSPGYIRCAPEYEGWPGYGDWLSINADTPRDLIGSAFFAYDAKLMAKIAEVLEKPDDAAHYQHLFEQIKQAFGKRYLKGSSVTAAADRPSASRKMLDEADAISRGNLAVAQYQTVASEVFNMNLFTPTQTAYVLALHFDLLPDDLRATAAAELTKDIQYRNMHLSTGFVGAPYLPHVLSKNGHLNTAYALLFQKTWPSWLYSVTQGATTIWERWDGWTEEAGFQSPDMNSFNHYAYGSIGAWMYNTVTGIEVDPEQPGYKHAILRPQPGGNLTQARGSLKTLYGDLVSDWSIEGSRFSWTVIIPPNTSATAYLPVTDDAVVTLDGERVAGTVHELHAGTYRFEAN